MKTPPAYELRKLMKRFISNTMRDLKVEGRDEFNRNFERQAFFTEAWARRRYDPDPSRSLLIKSGRLRQSIKSRIEGNTIIYESTEPYAAIHNEGGRIKVTRRMKGYFWYLYREATGSRQLRKDGKLRNNKHNRRLSDAAQFYRAMALKPVGSEITIPKRQFIGEHPQFTELVRQIVLDNYNEIFS